MTCRQHTTFVLEFTVQIVMSQSTTFTTSRYCLARAIVALPLALLLLVLPLNFYAQSVARTLPRGLDQLTEEADVIVHGFITSTKVEPHPQLRNLRTVVVTISVKDTYKGARQKSLTFRQYVWNFDPRHATSEYGKGQEMVLLLGPVSEYGLTSPVGLEQGRFRVSLDKKGQAVAVNGRGNQGLFNSVEDRARAKGLQLSAHTLAAIKRRDAAPLSLADLEDAIRTFARNR